MHTHIYLLVCSCAYTCTDQDIRAKAQDFRAKDPSVHSIIVRRRTHIYIHIYTNIYIYIHVFCGAD